MYTPMQGVRLRPLGQLSVEPAFHACVPSDVKHHPAIEGHPALGVRVTRSVRGQHLPDSLDPRDGGTQKREAP